MKTIYKFLAGLMILSLASCSKDKAVQGPSVTDPDPDIYIYGNNNANGPIYYKNGVLNLSFFELGNSVTKGAMLIHNNDIYLPAEGGYFKNGQRVILPNASTINSIFVKGNDVYVTGWRIGTKASYWKNNEMIKLQPDSSTSYVTVGKIIVGGNGDVYVGGQNQQDLHIIYWKNQELHTLERGFFVDMALSGDDLHIVGSGLGPGTGEGLYFKNDVKYSLIGFNNQRPAYTTSISVWNNDIYITGGLDCALYWKNGQPFGEIHSSTIPTGLVVVNGKVYVVANSPAKTVTLWKDGISEVLSEGMMAINICLGN